MTETDNQNQPTDLLANLLDDPLTTPAQPTLQSDSPAAPQSAQPKLYAQLAPAQQEAAQKLATDIDVHNPQSVMDYGAPAQTKLSEFSQGMLSKVQSQDTGAIGDALSDLMFRLNEASPSDLQAGDNNLFKRMFSKVKKSIFEINLIKPFKVV